ncbi:hypothetical protein [Saccharopolyspora sp. 5N708]
MSDRKLVVVSAGLSQPSSTRLLAARPDAFEEPVPFEQLLAGNQN